LSFIAGSGAFRALAKQSCIGAGGNTWRPRSLGTPPQAFPIATTIANVGVAFGADWVGVCNLRASVANFNIALELNDHSTHSTWRKVCLHTHTCDSMTSFKGCYIKANVFRRRMSRRQTESKRKAMITVKRERTRYRIGDSGNHLQPINTIDGQGAMHLDHQRSDIRFRILARRKDQRCRKSEAQRKTDERKLTLH
jgi:hypothetical protein